MALLHVNFYSSVLGMSVTMDVILPQRIGSKNNMEGNIGLGKYKTLYLLHGMNNDHTAWQRNTSIERYVRELGIAVVMPTTHLGWYTDTAYGLKYWTFISKELLEICRDFFPNMSDKREDTFAAGLSMGGYGAFKLGLRANETFGAVASLSGVLDMVRLKDVQQVTENNTYWEGIFGSFDKVEGSENDLIFLAEKLKHSGNELPKLYACCGQEDFLYQSNIEAVNIFKNLGYDITFEESHGSHEWNYWDNMIQKVLQWLPIT